MEQETLEVGILSFAWSGPDQTTQAVEHDRTYVPVFRSQQELHRGWPRRGGRGRSRREARVQSTAPFAGVVGTPPEFAIRLRLRRAVNVVAALMLMVLTAPLMALIGFLVKVTSPGPILFHQPRVGIDRRNPRDRRSDGRGEHDRRGRDGGGLVFTIMKFRTMECGVDAYDQVWASPDDPRITPLGRFLRLSRLDELPQVFNVMRGEMNLVGPRPEQPVIFEELRERIEGYPVRQRVLPGITGWAQVNQSYDQCLDDVQRKTDLDLEYIERCSPVEDLKIMARTLPVMLFRRGGL